MTNPRRENETTPAATANKMQPQSPATTPDHYLASGFGLLVAGLVTSALSWRQKRNNRSV
ncbi:hypothetical protein WG78_00845 [Amantichitinum ursilacus]|uniref:Uncharacterized protein n=1 Tax=Amantichitinum ursilacus TaxID=857265 RepID=A0A0N0XMK0_9NEIS|nr:hypothetical protein WG78_00845 [Amantichitinum ursilacus]